MRSTHLKILLLLVVVGVVLTGASAAVAAPVSFHVMLNASPAPAADVDGRLVVIAADPAYASPDWGYTEPRQLPGDFANSEGLPAIWGKEVTGMGNGDSATLDSASTDSATGTYGFPFVSTDELPPGDYWIQAVLNTYTSFQRADGFTLDLIMPGNGENTLDNPGSYYSQPQMVTIPSGGGTVDISLTDVVQPSEPVPPGGTAQQGNPTDSRHVKHVKIKSGMLSQFWGQDMYIGADVLLPSGYFKKANAHRKYPVVCWDFHFPTRNPGGFVEPPGVQKAGRAFWTGDARFSQWWLSGKAPQMIYVQFREQNPYGETAYMTDSPNMGPYDTAEHTELWPALEKQFRMYKGGWSRTVSGISSGGWMAAAQQIYHPADYVGAWVFSPDSMSFETIGTADLYADDSFFYYPTYAPFSPLPRPDMINPDGTYADTQEHYSHWELALGGGAVQARSGSYDGIWGENFAMWGPQGTDGYPAPFFDLYKGDIDHAVTAQMHDKDLADYTVAHWPTIGKALHGKLHIWAGTKDAFFLNLGVESFQEHVAGLTSP
ncbi:MAG TPA: alpha/beta hydrolase-fold protein, partial [Thermoleophilia bacterium]